LAVLHQIPEQHRQIIELRLAGLTTAEIAGALQLTRAAVKSAQTRAYARLRDLLAAPSLPTDGVRS
jgi:DNA-directed RNA polymerase specialized sigma24 family protein